MTGPLAPTTFGVGQLLRRLGVKGPRLPLLNQSEYQSVVVMGDFSKSLAAEPFERRAIVGRSVVVAPAQQPTIEIASIGPGVVVEQAFGLITAVATSFVRFARLGGRFSSFASAIPGAPVGGLPTRSIVNFFSSGVDISTLGPFWWDMPNAQAGAAWLFRDLRWFIPPGETLLMQGTVAASADLLGLLWRELEEGVGPA